MWSVVTLRSALAVALVLAGRDLAARQSDRQPVDQFAPQRVAQWLDLRALTLDDRIRAQHFDRPDGRPLRSGSLIIFSEPPLLLSLQPADSKVPRPSMDARMRARVCAAQALVVARPREARAFLTASETFLFTNYTLDIEHWIRPTTGERSLVVSRPGGEAYVGQVDVRAVRLHPQRRGIFLLTSLPKTLGFLFDTVMDASGPLVSLEMLVGPDKLEPTELTFDDALRRLTHAASNCHQ
jgi:hypothetical protein